MKLFRLFVFVLLISGLNSALVAATRTLTISAPATVNAGQSIAVPCFASTDQDGNGEQIGFFHADYSTNGGASWTGFCYDVNIGAAATRNAYITAGSGGSTIIVRVRIAYRGGSAGDVDYNGGALDWAGTWTNWQIPPTKYAYISVLAAETSPTAAMSIKGVSSGTVSGVVGETVSISISGADADGDLRVVNLWVCTPVTGWRNIRADSSLNGGYVENITTDNALSSGGANVASLGPVNRTFNITLNEGFGTYQFVTRSMDSRGYNSYSQQVNVAVGDVPPRVTMSASPTSIYFGQSTNVSATATDTDGNLAFHGLLVLFQDGSNWYRGAMCDHSNGWGNHPTTPDILSANYTSGACSGGTSTKTFVHRPSWTGNITYHSNTHDGILWASSDGANWAQCVGYAGCTVNKATPSASFSAQSFTGSRTLTAADLSAAFANPYSGAVAPPTGAITYSIVSASGAGASPTSGAVAVGTSLAPGTYTIRASYAGDANYNATTADAVFTLTSTNVAPTAAMSIKGASSGTVTGVVGETISISISGADADGNLRAVNLWVNTPAGGSLWRNIRADSSVNAGFVENNTSDNAISSAGANVAALGAATRTFSVTLNEGFGTYRFVTRSIDALSVASGSQEVDVTVANRAPSGLFTINGAAASATVNFGQSVAIASTVTDPDGNLTVHSFWWDQGSGLYWTHPVLVWSYPANQSGWTDLNLGPDSYAARSGSSSAKSFTFTANRAATFVFHSAAYDGIAWVGVGNSVMNVVVNQTTPTGTFPAKTLDGPRTLTTADLNATFANPYSGAVAAPTGAPTYIIVSATGAGASPTSGAVAVGTTLTPGTYTLRASYPGDANYNAATTDAVFTINSNDIDNDGIPNSWETANGLNPNSAGDALLDPDGDGLTNVAEYNLGTNPNGYNQGTSIVGGAIPAGWASLAAEGDATKAVGATAGELNVDKSGALNYSVPIWTTPGTAGMEPKVSLNYSSQAGPGIAGYGWSVSGVSAISRGGQSKAIDGQNLGMTISATDRFYLDGQRLILISGTYGAAGSEYRTELDSFTKVVAYGTRGSGPASFKAWTKAGLIIEFGNTDDSTFDAWGHTEPFNWSVNKISDTKGNYMTFSYYEDAFNGIYRLSRIDYTGNSNVPVAPYASLRFNYESRPDWSKGYSAGSPVSNLSRLASITSHFGETVARTYTLGYTNRTTANLRSLLTSLTETGADGKSYPPLNFNYEAPTGGWSTLNYYSAPNYPYLPLPYNFLLAQKDVATGAGFMDLDGDGYPDLVRKKNSNSGDIYNDAYLNTTYGWSSNVPLRLPPVIGLAWQDRPNGGRVVDVDGDGLPDALFANWNAGYAWHNTGTGWDSSVISALPYPDFKFAVSQSISDSGRRIVDINGDGLPDMVWNLNGTDKGCYINNSNGHFQAGGPAWVSAPQWAPPFLIMADETSGANFFDVNGDGLPDVIQMGFGVPLEVGIAINSPSGWYVNNNANWKQKTYAFGTAFSTIQNEFGLTTLGKYLPPAFLNKEGAANSYSPSPLGSELVDLNGDGLVDILFSNSTLTTSIDATFRTAKALLNTGNGWVVSAEYLPPPGVQLLGRPGSTDNTDSTGAVMVDLNADGLPDIAINKVGQPNVYYLNTGHGWGSQNDSSLANFALPLAITNSDVTIPTGAQIIDLNADGVADIISNSGYAYNLAKPTADKLIKVTNGLGVSASVGYALLTERDVPNPVYAKEGPRSTYPVADITGPMLVVKTVSNDDGTYNAQGQPNPYDVTYKYTNLRTDKLRGSLGFEKMTVTDGRTGIVSETTSSQTYPTIGMPIYSTTKTSGGALLSESSVFYDSIPLNSGKTRFVFATSSLSTSWDLNTTMTSKTDTEIAPADIDAYGNILRITVSSTDLPGTALFTKVTTSTYEPADTINWVLGRLSTASVTSSAPGVADITRTSSFTYFATNGLLKTETVQAGDAAMALTTTYAYDAFGNKTSATSSGANLIVNDTTGAYTPSGTLTRTTSTAYDANGRFPLSTTNAAGHTESYTGYDQVKGVLLSMTGANGLATSWVYDGMGRKLQENRADGTRSYTYYRWASAYAPAGSKYLVESVSDGSAPSLAFYDNFGRAFIGLGINGDGKIVYQRTAYDSMGRAYAKTNPYYNDGSTVYWTTTNAYDLLNRPLSVTTPDDENGASNTTFSYNGLASSVTDPKSRINSTAKNAQGWTTSVTRNEQSIDGAIASVVFYSYDALGNLLWTNASGTYTYLAYDIRGRKTSMTDADMGTWQYRYNIFGELIWQKDAKNQVVKMDYDNLGRLTSRTEYEGTTTWTYDTASGKGIGKLASVSAPGNYGESYSYDTLGRPTASTRTIDGTAYAMSTDYDGYGRPLRTAYPDSGIGSSALATRNVYNAFGYLKEIRNWRDEDSENSTRRTIANPTGRVYWEADHYDVSGRIDSDIYGNGLSNDRGYAASTGRLVRATIDRGGSAILSGQSYFVQDLTYHYDRMGNVMTRTDTAPNVGRAEAFTYDGLDRLKTHTINGGSLVSVDYAMNGNIAYKSDVGTYGYSGVNAGPHAVTSAGNYSTNMVYDPNGNLTYQTLTSSGANYGNRTTQWTSFNQVRKITDSGTNKSSEFFFGAGHERVKQIRKNGNTPTDTTIYVGSLYEKVTTDATNLVEHKYYIMSPSGRVAVYTQSKIGTTLQADALRYFHTDGLGSITAITDEKGAIVKRYAYDAWGKQTTLPDNAPVVTNQTPTTRGFTDHEMLADHGLIHMNGRVYDPTLGRFISADPNVDGVSDAQGYNRYSYVGNNPLGATDPTGFFKLKEILGAIIAIVVTAVVIVCTAGTGAPATAGFWGQLVYGLTHATLTQLAVAGAAGGFAGGFSGSLLNGGSLGDAFKSGLIGAATGAATAWAGGVVGRIFGPLSKNPFWEFGRALAHGAAGGAITEASGGEFRHGFYAGFAGSVAGSIAPSLGMGKAGDQVGSHIAARTAFAALVGGTASVLGGGKFANGAITAAFQHLFNAEHTRRIRLVIAPDGDGNNWNKMGASVAKYLNGYFNRHGITFESVNVATEAEFKAAFKGADGYILLAHHEITDEIRAHWSDQYQVGWVDPKGPDTYSNKVFVSTTALNQYSVDNKILLNLVTCGKGLDGLLYSEKDEIDPRAGLRHAGFDMANDFIISDAKKRF